VRYFEKLPEVKKMRIMDIFNKCESAQVIFGTQVSQFSSKLNQENSIAILSPCCAEFHYGSIHQKKRTANTVNNGQNLSSSPIPVSRFCVKLNIKISMAVLSPCCAEFRYGSIHQKKRTANLVNNGKICLVALCQCHGLAVKLKRKFQWQFWAPSVHYFEKLLPIKKIRILDIFNKCESAQVIFCTGVSRFGGKLKRKISMAILSPCCAEYQYDSIHEMMRMVNPDNNFQKCLVVRPIPVLRFGGKIE
jgi:hypothetical protein